MPFCAFNKSNNNNKKANGTWFAKKKKKGFTDGHAILHPSLVLAMISNEFDA